MLTDGIWGVNAFQLLLLYLVVAITFVYLLYKYRLSSLHFFVILIFYPALFTYFGPNVHNLYKIILLAFCLYISFKRNIFNTLNSHEIQIVFSFLIFTFSFFISILMNGDSITITFSQYSRYLIIFCLFFLFKKEILHPRYDSNILTRLIYDLLFVQIVVSLAKYIIIGVNESLVGTISFTGGAEGTILPILAFIFLWYYRKGSFGRKDYLFILGFFFLGYLAGKRAIWFVLPIVMGLFIYYIPKRSFFSKTLFIYIALITLVFYFGIRLTPSLNQENKVWGSFNIDFAIKYAEFYSFGGDDKIKNGVVQGRGSATMLLLNNLFHKEFNQNDWWGYGFSDMYSTDYDEFDQKDFGLNHKGSATGVFQSYVTMGYIGIFTTFFFAWSMISLISNKRILYSIIAVFFWEYLFYTGLLLRTPAFMFLLLFVVVKWSYTPPKLLKPSIE